MLAEHSNSQIVKDRITCMLYVLMILLHMY
jgi:hypothetical protein